MVPLEIAEGAGTYPEPPVDTPIWSVAYSQWGG